MHIMPYVMYVDNAVDVQLQLYLQEMMLLGFTYKYSEEYHRAFNKHKNKRSKIKVVT